jgi:hypothetical protein
MDGMAVTIDSAAPAPTSSAGIHLAIFIYTPIESIAEPKPPLFTIEGQRHRMMAAQSCYVNHPDRQCAAALVTGVAGQALKLSPVTAAGG